MFIVDSPDPVYIWHPVERWIRIDTLTLSKLEGCRLMDDAALRQWEVFSRVNPRCSTFSQQQMEDLLNARYQG